MIILGGREDIVAQWFSKDFILKYSGFFKEVVIGPGEYALIIKNGQIVEVVTQQKLEKLSGGFLDVVKRWLGGGEDLQILIVDVRPKRIEIGFEGYTRDRVKVAGKVNLLVRISPKDAVNIIKLMYGPTKLRIPHRVFYTVSKGKARALKDKLKGKAGKVVEEKTYQKAQEIVLEEGMWIKELTTSDLQEKLQEELNAAFQANVLIKRASNEFHENMEDILEDSKNVIESLKPLWLSFGIEVITATFAFDKNAYEELQRRARELELERMEKDILFLREIGDEKRAAELEKEKEKIKYDLELFHKFKDFDSQRVDMGIQYELNKIALEYDFGIEDLKKKFEQELGYNAIRRDFDFEAEMATKKQDITHTLEGKEIAFEHAKELADLEHKIGLEERAIDHETKIKDFERTEAIKDAEVESRVRDIGVMGEAERQKIVARAEAFVKQLQASSDYYAKMKELDIEERKVGIEQDVADREASRDMAIMREMVEMKKQLEEMKLKHKQVEGEIEVKKIAYQADVEKTKAMADAEARKAEALAKAEALKAENMIGTYEKALEGQRKHELEKEKLEIEKVRAMTGLVKEPQVVNVQPSVAGGGGRGTKVCPHCGRTIDASALYCPFCGKRVE